MLAKFRDHPLCVKAKGTYELLNNWLPIDACIELTGNRINLGTAHDFYTDKKEIKFSSYIRKFRVEQLQVIYEEGLPNI